MGLIVFGALVVRLLHVWAIEGSPFGPVLLGDSAGYDRWAREIAGGDWIGSDVFYQAPLYPYLLGLLYTVIGSEPVVVRVAQALLSAAACGLLALAGARFFSPTVGVVAGALLAVYAPAIFMDTTLQKSVLDLFLLTGLLALLARAMEEPSTVPRSWIGIGALLGLLALSRENALVLVAALGVWVWRARVDMTRRLVLVAAGLAVVLLPVAARNAVVGGGFHLTTSQLGPNLYIGNHAGSDGTYNPLRYGRGDPSFERDDATQLAEAAEGRSLTPSEVSRYWVGETLADIGEDPVRWIGLLGRKAALTVNGWEAMDTESQYAYADHSWLLVVTGWLTHFGVLVPLALVGALATWSRRDRLEPLHLMLVVYAASVVAFYVFGRYRYPMVPFLVLLAAAGAVHLVELARGRATAVVSTGTLVALLVVTGAVTNYPLLSADAMRAVSYNNLGTAYRERGDQAAAIEWYERAVALGPDQAQTHSNLASALTATGALTRAVDHYEQAVALDPDAGGIRFNFGNALAAAGRYERAVDEYEEALVAWPDDSEAHNNLGMALGNLGRNVEAAEAFRAALAIDPTDAYAHGNLAIVLAELGDRDGARRHRSEAARLASQMDGRRP